MLSNVLCDVVAGKGSAPDLLHKEDQLCANYFSVLQLHGSQGHARIQSAFSPEHALPCCLVQSSFFSFLTVKSHCRQHVVVGHQLPHLCTKNVLMPIVPDISVVHSCCVNALCWHLPCSHCIALLIVKFTIHHPVKTHHRQNQDIGIYRH